MNPLLKRLAALRWRVRLLDGWQGTCALIALVLGVGVAVGALDFWLHLPGLVRAVFLVGLLVGSGMVAHHYLIRPFSKTCDDLTLALRVEEAYPELNDALASTVQFLQQSPEEQTRVGGSEDMRQRTMKQTMESAALCDFSRILDRKSAALFGAAAACALLVAGLAVGMNRAYSTIAFWRLVEPFGGHTWTRIAVSRQAPRELVELQAGDQRWETLDPKSGKKDRIAIGRPYFIKVDIQGQIPKHAKVEIEGQIRTDKQIELKPTGPDKRSASFMTGVDMTQQYQKFRFRVLANDGAFPPRAGAWHEVEVLPPPKLIDLDGQPSPQIAIYPPAYTDLASPQRLEPGTRTLEVFAGSDVVLRARADRKLEQAWIEYRPENALVIPASLLTFFGQTNPLQAAALAAGGNAVWGRIPAQFEADGATFRIAFKPSLSGVYLLYLRDFDGLERSEPADLRVNVDPAPTIKLLRPGSSLTASPIAKIPFKFHVADEVFAAKSVWVEYRRKGADDTVFGDVQKIPLYDAQTYGRLAPWQIAAALRSPAAARDLRLRYQKLEFETLWPLKNQFRGGDVLSIEICADDFCDIYPAREPGRSRAIELRIVGKQQIVQDAEKDLAAIQKNLQALENKQKQALDTVKETQKQEKIDPKARDNFNDNAVQPQREIQETIGNTPKDGLRRDVARARQTLKENDLTDTPAYRDLSKIQGTLESISQEELPKIEPKLNQANNDLAKNDKNTPQIKKTLDEAARPQKSVLDALSELNQQLDPNGKIREITEQARKIAADQEQIRQKLQDLNNRKKELDEVNKDNKGALKQIEDDTREKINQTRNEQLDLNDKMEKFVEKMKAAKEEFAQKGDKENAKKLKEAIDKAEKPKAAPKQEEKLPIEAQMKQVAKDLANKTEVPQETLQQQENIQKDLEKVLDAIEGRTEDSTKQELANREKAEQKLNDISKKLDKLREKTKKADMIEDKEERLKAKKELAKEHEALQDEINKQRRELARLNEQRAVNALNEAAQKLEKAGEKLQNGEDPDKEQREAKQEIQKAKQELKEAQEELARELLIKIADQLEGLKVRQIASLERSESFHAKVMKRKIWTDAFLDTIEGNIDAQKDIGEETDTLKDKLKGAKVFASILEKAKDSMDKAGKVMKIRFDQGVQRRQKMFEDDEIKDEIDWHADTVKHQRSAYQRLDRLLDSLKEEIAKKRTKKEPQAAENDPMNPDKEKKEPGGMRAQDGIPPMAQLKALRAEQFDLNQRTEDFAKRNPDLTKLNDDQQGELRELSQEQERIHNLFQELVAPPQEPKEGDLK